MSELEMRHAQMVTDLAKPGNDIVSEMTPEHADLWHHATGIAGEGGEILDAAKKVAIYNKTPDRENFVEELGDLEFYMAGLRQNLGITREETLQGNLDKLAKRYPGYEYTDAAAQARADKKDTE